MKRRRLPPAWILAELILQSCRMACDPDGATYCIFCGAGYADDVAHHEGCIALDCGATQEKEHG